MINGEIVTDIHLRQDDIDRWKAQFNQEYPKVLRKTHKDLLWVKVEGLPFRIKRRAQRFLGGLKKRFRSFAKEGKKMQETVSLALPQREEKRPEVCAQGETGSVSILYPAFL